MNLEHSTDIRNGIEKCGHRKKILLTQYTLQPPGGGNAVATWILEALKDLNEVTVLTWVPFEPKEIDNFYGTELAESNIVQIQLPALARRLFSLDPNPYEFYQKCYLRRLCKIISQSYDLIISADNETDFGRPGIHYVHFPWQYALYKKMCPELSDSSDARAKLIRLRTRWGPWRLISDNSFKEMSSNLTLVNSDWTGPEVYRRYGIKAKTLYPPVHGVADVVPWEKRRNGFVSIGRISDEKRLEVIIEILHKVRAEGNDVSLNIIGTIGTRKFDRDYFSEIQRRIAGNKDWIILHENPSREEIVDLIPQHRYGIHGNVEEHFGIAVAEMVQAGCIPFVPNNGGQVEIVGHDERLIYSDPDDAVRKIVNVLQDQILHENIRNALAPQAESFGAERFIREIRAIVREFE